MKVSVVVGTNYGREHWLDDFLSSVRDDIPLYVVKGPGYEVGHIKHVYENTDIDRFIYFQDSFVIRDNDMLLKILTETEGSLCLLCNDNHPNSYAGLYERETLNKIEIPFAENKARAMYYEKHFIQTYKAAAEKFSCYPNPLELGWYGEKHGRENMIYVSPLYYKFVGNWGQKSPEDYEKDPYM